MTDPGPDSPGSATFRALAWSQEEIGDDLVPYTGENPYETTQSDVRPVLEYVPTTGRIYQEPRRPWHRMTALAIGIAAVIAIITVGGVAYALTSATESTKASEAPKPQPPKQPEPEPPSPPKQESPPTAGAAAPTAGTAVRGDDHQRGTSAAPTADTHVDADDGAGHHHENDHDVADHDDDVTDHHHDVADHHDHDDNHHDHEHNPVDDDELHHGPVRSGAGADPGPQPGAPSAGAVPAAGVPAEPLGLVVAHWMDEQQWSVRLRPGRL